jgi:hypothetical protein
VVVTAVVIVVVVIIIVAVVGGKVGGKIERGVGVGQDEAGDDHAGGEGWKKRQVPSGL